MENVTLKELMVAAARKHPDFTVTEYGVVYNAPYKDTYQMEPGDVDGILSDAKEQNIPVAEALYNFLVESMGYDVARVEGRDIIRELLKKEADDAEKRGINIEDYSELDADERDEELDAAADELDVDLPLDSYKTLFPELDTQDSAEWDDDKEAYMPDTWANVD